MTSARDATKTTALALAFMTGHIPGMKWRPTERQFMIVWGALVFIALGALPAVAETVVLAQCGASKGQAFYFEGGLVPPGQGGWKTDGSSDGKLAAIYTDKGLDIVFRDATGVRSHLAEGSSVRLVAHDEDEGTFLITAENKTGRALEHFLFRLNKIGVGTVVWGTTRISDLFTKSSLMTAVCGPRE